MNISYKPGSFNLMAFWRSLGFLIHILVTISMFKIATASPILNSAQLDKTSFSNGLKVPNNSTKKILAAYIFGDSTVDPGNNNLLVTDVKSNFPPYGVNFLGGQPTGRFSDGRLVTDFVASYVGLKDYIPPYLDPTLSLEELKTGVSFASAASGFDPLTPRLSNVLSISKELEYFREYRAKMERIIGKDGMDHIIERSAFLISTGGINDFALNYFLLPVRRLNYTVPEYQQFLVSQLQQLIQELVKEGAKIIGVVGLPPLGCVPIMITIFSKDRFAKRDCIEYFSSVARSYNEVIKNEIISKRYESDLKIVYADIYTPLGLIVHNPKMFGFEEIFEACCGTGLVETSFLCNPVIHLCPDPSKYVFFDSVHPTEKTYRIIFESLKPTIDSLLEGL